MCSEETKVEQREILERARKAQSPSAGAAAKAGAKTLSQSGIESSLASEVLGTPVPAGILSHILGDKFVKSARASVSGQAVTSELVRTLLGHVVHQKFEQRAPSGDVYDELLGFLCGGTLLPCTHGRLIKRV